MDAEAEMAERFFGYGRWGASYWFIGPEQGRGPDEARKNEGNAKRARVWMDLGATDLCDCKLFHRAMGETCWHRDNPEKPRLQSTWKALMLPLMVLLGKDTDPDTRRNYQREFWGRAEGETCVIELCGLAAMSSAEPMERKEFLRERIATIRQQLQVDPPKVVVMYGFGERKSWEEIAGCRLLPDEISKRDGTCFVMTPHTNTRGRRNEEWIELGERLRRTQG